MDRQNQLLFGIFALQFNFISREDLVAVTTEWTRDESIDMAELLSERGVLTSDRRQLLEQLIDEHSRTAPDQSLSNVVAGSSLGSIAEDLRSLGSEEVDHTVDTVVAASRKAKENERTQPFQPEGTDVRGRFRVLRPHAKGGLGQVSVALDRDLNREVAFKEINPNHAHIGESRARFIQEAEITGSLEHPGIVPVYGLGTQTNGRPFYVMRFVKGDSLKEAIARFHKGESRDDRSLQLRQLLGRFVDVCNAVEYAHSRGVLHRDLKPGNVMLGRYGETLVVDWGLAKPVGRKELNRTSGEETVRPSGSGSTLTIDGEAIGTPAYMSPEQAEGRTETLNAASDVYSLGATLYCLLTGQSPFAGQKVRSVLPMVAAGQFKPPRELCPAVAPALNAICMKAMALNPEDRYGSAAHLALDVERWMADELVSAHPESLVESAGRFFRRHRSLALATAAALCLVTVVSVLAAVFVSDAHRETTLQLHKAEALRLAAISESLRQTAPNRAGLAALESLRVTRDHGLDAMPEAISVVCNTLPRVVGDLVCDFDGPIYELRLSPDEKRLLVRSYRDEPWIITLDQSAAPRQLLNKVGSKPVERQQPKFQYISEDWKTVVRARFEDNCIEIFDLDAGQTREVVGETELPRITSLAVGPNYEWVAGTYVDKKIRVWDLMSPEATPSVVVDSAWQIDLQTVSKERVISFSGKTIQTWKITPQSLELERTVPVQDPDGARVEVSPNRKWILEIGRSGKHRLSSVRNPEAKRNFEVPAGQGRVEFSIKSDHAAFVSAKGEITVLDLGDAGFTRLLPQQFPDGVAEVVFDDSGDRVAVMSWNDQATVWDIRPENPRLLARFAPHDAVAREAIFFKDSDSLLTADMVGLVRRVDLSRTQDTELYRHFRIDTDVKQIVCRPGSSDIYLLGGKVVHQNYENPGQPKVIIDKFARGGFVGDKLMVAHLRGVLTLDPEAVEHPEKTLPIEMSALSLADFSPDGQWMAACGDSELWFLENGEWKKRSPEGLEGGGHWDMKFSPDSKRVAIAERAVGIWSLSDLTQRADSFSTNGALVYSVNFSADGRWLAAGTVDGTGYLWDLAATDPHKTRITLSGHTGTVTKLCFSADGRWIATASSDDSIRLRETGNNPESNCIVIRSPYKSTVSAVAFTPDNRWLVAADNQGNAFMWALDFDKIAEELRRRIGRPLTDDERREFRIQTPRE